MGRALGRAVNFDWADQPVLAGRNGEEVMTVAVGADSALRHRQQLPVEGHIQLSFGGDGDGLCTIEVDSLRELHRHIVGVLLPERRKHRATLRAAVIENISQPDIEVAGIPYPCCLILHDLLLDSCLIAT